ncbi:hypothetical protein, partial [Escherichia coli]|uniref:hypothetical protein n=1 Tax=Escherichia coli TaxID=562 RepID=UPI0019D5F872
MYRSLHGAGCLPVSSAWCHQTRVFSLTIIKEIIPFTSRPSAQGDSPCSFFLKNSHPGRQHSTDLIVRYVTFLLNGYKKSQPLGEAGKLVEQNAVT